MYASQETCSVVSLRVRLDNFHVRFAGSTTPSTLSLMASTLFLVRFVNKLA